MEDLDVVVAGAGVVGLAIARALAMAGREVLVVEAEPAIGMHTSSHNSEVIHAGLYYPTDSLKARLCTRGRELLYAYCAERGIPHRAIGKVLIASNEAEASALGALARQARINGVDLEPLTAAQVRAREPAVRAQCGYWSPRTGIVDSHALMLALQGDAQAHGATLVFRTRIDRGEARDDATVLHTVGVADARGDGGASVETLALRCRLFVNAAGFGAQDLARRIVGPRAVTPPPLWLAKGHYFTLAGRSPFRHLVYPVPGAGGLGIHVTLDLAGQARFGPDVSAWLQAPDYRFQEGLEGKFYGAIRQYWPDLPDGALQPGYTGLRPKLSGPGEPAADFMICGGAAEGSPHAMHLFGIESPGLTSSLAIAEFVSARALGS